MGGYFTSADTKFFPDKLRGLEVFCLQEYRQGAYVIDSFVRRVQDAELKGFDFVRIWPLPSGTNYVSLHKRKERKRERAELPRGKTLKGNSLLIGLALKAATATKTEQRHIDRLMNELDKLLVDTVSKAPAVGNLEGHEYKQRECRLSLNGPDADVLLKKLRPWLKALDWPNGFKVLKRYGEYYQEDARTVPVRSLGRKKSK